MSFLSLLQHIFIGSLLVGNTVDSAVLDSSGLCISEKQRWWQRSCFPSSVLFLIPVLVVRMSFCTFWRATSCHTASTLLSQGFLQQLWCKYLLPAVLFMDTLSVLVARGYIGGTWCSTLVFPPCAILTQLSEHQQPAVILPTKNFASF